MQKIFREIISSGVFHSLQSTNQSGKRSGTLRCDSDERGKPDMVKIVDRYIETVMGVYIGLCGREKEELLSVR